MKYRLFKQVRAVWSAEAMGLLVDVMTAHPSQPVVQHFALSCLQVRRAQDK
jgi:hypothetical protein